MTRVAHDVLEDGICVDCQPAQRSHELADGTCVTCSPVVARFDPHEPREPHSGKWVKTPGGGKSAAEKFKKFVGHLEDGDNDSALGEAEKLDLPDFESLTPRQQKDLQDELETFADGKFVDPDHKSRAQAVLEKMGLRGPKRPPEGGPPKAVKPATPKAEPPFDEQKFTSAASGQAARRAMTYNFAVEDSLEDRTFGHLTGRQVAEAVGDYGDRGYDQVNPHLRELKGRPDRFPDTPAGIAGYGKLHYTAARAERLADGLDAAFAESKTTKPIVVNRGMHSLAAFGSRANGDLTGTSFVDHGYVSTSVNRNASAEFTGNGAGVSMRILAPAGTPAISSHNLDRDELLLGRGLTFTIVRDRTVKGVRMLDVEVGR